jgi:hypothetical protein
VLPADVVAAGGAYQATAGRLERGGDGVRFVPRFPFLAGTEYAVLVDGVETGRIALAPPGPGTTAVVAIHPTAARVPLNLLRLYVRFSTPMSEGAARAVTVRRADTGEPLEHVFLPPEPELWDPARTRLTLLLDPGRIKRGLRPHEEAGYPLVEGVAIVVDVAADVARDAGGRVLRHGGSRRYDVGPPLRSRVDPADWRCTAPQPGTTEPLAVSFDRPLDRALLERCLDVLDRHGEPVAGDVAVAPGEDEWRFRPAEPWGAGPHALSVDTTLEDVAGNSVRRVFDRDLDRRDDDPLDEARVVVPLPPPAG